MHIASITSHPIQYQVPLWRELAHKFERFEGVFLTDHGLNRSFDREFGQAFAWDLDMLGGYKSRILNSHGSFDMAKFFGVCLPPQFRRDLVRSFDLVWIEGWRYKGFVDAIRICSRNNIPFLIRGESNLLAIHSTAKLVAKRLALSYLLRRASAFLCIGSANRKFYRWLGLNESKFLDAPYFVDNDRFTSHSDSCISLRSSFRERWGIATDAKVILFCGKLIRKKHPDHVLRAVSELQRRFPNVDYHVLFVGNGELGDQLKMKCRVVFDSVDDRGVRLVSDASIDLPKVSFAGFLNQSQIVEAYVASDLLVLPSDAGETWGLVVNEAMASGIPTVTSDLVGCAVDLPSKLDKRSVYRFGEIEDLASSINWMLHVNYDRSHVQSIASTHHMSKTVESFLLFAKSLNVSRT